MSQSSFYGGRPGISFRIVKRFDGIDIPQNPGSIVYKRKEYAIRTITDVKYFVYPFVEKTGSNYQDYDWDICVLDGGSKNVVYSNNTTGTETVDAVHAEGMIQCFSQGGTTTHEVNYGEYVIIDTIKDMADYDSPDNGKLFRRGTNLNYDAETNPYYGGELVGTLVGPRGYPGEQGPQGMQGEQGPQGEKGEQGNYNILGIYATAGDIPNQPPETIMGSNDYRGWDIAVGDITDPDSEYRLYVYDYRLGTWNDVGIYSGGDGNNIYTVCSTAGDVAAKTVNLTNYILTTGARLIVKFENENTADNPTLNVTNTGAKALTANGVSAKDVITAGSVFLVVYDGTNYVLVGGVGSASDNDFIGTTAEWNALSPAEQDRYANSIIFITDDTSGGGGGSGGHVIVNSSDVSMTQRSKLKFVNATVTDDEINDTTIVTATGTTAPIATDSTPGIVQPDGTTITVDANGIITSAGAPVATDTTVGVSKPDNKTITISDGVLTASGEIAEERTLLQSGWDSNGVYDMTSWYPNASYDITDILPNENTTTAQRKAWIAASCGGYRSTNTIKANGTIPSIDIIVEVFVREK